MDRTEGSAFNHATDRVGRCCHDGLRAALAGSTGEADHRDVGSGTVRQSAFKADPVRRTFRAEDGSEVELSVPGSFYEFISRDSSRVPTARAARSALRPRQRTGIFKMTAA